LAGMIASEGRAVEWRPSPYGLGDERILAELVERRRLTKSDYGQMVVDAWYLVARDDFARLEHAIAACLLECSIIDRDTLITLVFGHELLNPEQCQELLESMRTERS
jgi:hypothetical protein